MLSTPSLLSNNVWFGSSGSGVVSLKTGKLVCVVNAVFMNRTKKNLPEYHPFYAAECQNLYEIRNFVKGEIDGY